jgi:hypothetical protein
MLQWLNAQKAGGIAIYADIEKTGNKKFMEMLGVDLDTINLYRYS